jgi:hypothetical protein
MQSHEHSMADAVRNHEATLDRLFDASGGFVNADPIECRHCGEAIEVDRFSTWLHVESCDESCADADTFAQPTEALVSELESIGVDVDNLEESATEALDQYGLSLEAQTVLTLTLAVGGPTVYLSAPVERDRFGSWERVDSVTFFDSWAVPRETVLSGDTSLVAMFDRHVESWSPASDD